MKRRTFIKTAALSAAVAAAIATPQVVSAAGDPVISNIQIRGLNRVSKGAVLLALPVKEGDVMTPQNTALAMQQLYATGDFDDVKLSRDGDTFIVTVKERPTIGAVDFSGNNNIKKEDLEKIINQQGIRVGEALNTQSLNQIQKSLEDFYHSSGMYQAKVNTVITQLPRNRVDIKIEITEGKAAEIQQINIVGNKSFDEDVLLAQMQLRDDVPWWNFMANQRFNGQKFRADLEALKTFYMDRGFVNFKVDSTSVELTPDRKGIYLTIAIDEGERYKVHSFSVRGDTLKYGAELNEAITLQEGEIYNQRRVTENEKTLASILGKYGYANSEVKAFPIYNDKEKTVDLNFNVNPGSRVHVSQVLITGNDSTDDTVIRRELRQMDGSWLSSEAIEVSKTRLNRTGYFETVDVTTENVGATDDTVNVNTKVKERPTGSISGGIGIGTDSGLTLQASISQNNLFGWGTRANITSYENDYRKHMEIGYTDPYFTVDNVSLGGRLYLDKYDGDDDEDVVDYTNHTYGATFNLGYPISETWFVNYNLGIEKSKIKNNGTRFEQSDVFFSMYSKDATRSVNFLDYKLGFDITHNSLDKGVFPTSGNKQTVSLTATTPNSDMHYYKATAETYHYFPIDMYHEYVFTVRGRIGYGNGYRSKNGVREILPFFDNFSLGGSEWMRGFSRNSIGPRALYKYPFIDAYYESSTSVGGNAFWTATAEFVIPTPLVAEAYKSSVRSAVFFDAGALWDTRSKMYTVDYSDPGKYRTSVGFALTWMSPMGPLSFNVAKAIKKYDGDDTQQFNFNIGSSF
ncbi:MAG: outer membrane protein assembly factor BamA [Succinatimonas sp.]|nr:outer membrane protein assembly factor BamA [Succinatimonas sp.]MCI7026350.1 outer membrane protein assembly factor BamA [Succinatimonas sp.]